MNGSLKKSSKILYGVCSCIIVLMVICYFGVSNSKGTYSATPTCDNGTTPKKISGKYYCCASGYNAISTSSGVKCIVNGYTASDLNTSNNTCTKSATESTTKISSKSSSGAAVTTIYTCTADGKAEVAKKLGYNSDECSCTSVTVGLTGTAPTSISVTCKKTQPICTIGVRQTLDGDSSDNDREYACYNRNDTDGTRVWTNAPSSTWTKNNIASADSCKDCYKCIVDEKVSYYMGTISNDNCFFYSHNNCPSSGTPAPTPPDSQPPTSKPSSTPGSTPSSNVDENPKTDSTPSSNVDDNPKTGSVAIFMVWIIALGTLIYSFVYFKQSKFE